jgi:acetyltransferase-like isoleucine patch superfamily enzyme
LVVLEESRAMEIAMGNMSRPLRRDYRKQIEASRASIANDVTIGENSIIHGDEVILRPGVRIGDRVEIVCDSLEIGPGCQIGSDSTILCPQISFGERCSIGQGVHAEVNQYFRLDRFGYIGARVSMVGQGISAGEYLFLDSDIIIGGGGARGPRAFLTLGRANSLHARSIINLSEPVTMGDYSGISAYVSLVTHFAYQSVLKGYGARFAPISIAEHVAIYINAIVLPGVTIGEWVTVGAGAVVVKDVPPHCLAVGNPAQVIRGPEGYPTPLDRQQKDSLVRTILADYLTNLELKGVKVISDSISSRGYATVEFEGKKEVIRFVSEKALASLGSGERPARDAGQTQDTGPGTRPDITLSAAPIPPEFWGRCHFDLERETLTGEPTRIAEDLRDYLRRRAIRIFTGQPFQSLPLVSLQRLQRRRGH